MSNQVSKSQVEAWLQSLPGQRGRDIPEEIYDKMFAVANGITQKIWGGYPMPHHMDELYKAGATTPDRIKEMYDALPHPVAPTVTVGEYEQHRQAKQMWDDAQQ